MAQLSEEQQQRLKRIRVTRGTGILPWSHLSSPTQRQEEASATIDLLLSLLDSDSQAAETFVGPCVSCGHNNYDAERKECNQRWMEGRMSVVCGCPCAKHNSLANVATTMRDKCVEKVREYLTDCRDEERGIIEAIAAELSCLTLDQVKPEKQK